MNYSLGNMLNGSKGKGPLRVVTLSSSVITLNGFVITI